MSTPATLHASLGDRIETAVGSILPYLSRAVWLIAKRLYYHNSKLISGDLSLSYTASTSTKALPADFGGLLGSPYVNGQTYKLLPIPSEDIRIFYEGKYVSLPFYYEVVGATLKLIPGASSAITVNGRYFAIPTALTATTDTLPWTTRFDDLMGEYLIEATKLRPIPESGMQQLIIGGIDDYIAKMERQATTRPARRNLRAYSI